MNYGELVVTKVGSRKWKVVEDWHTPFGVIPKGKITNGANVPWIFWWFIRPEGDLFEASVFHDVYYNEAYETKAYADKSFREIAKHYGCPKWKYVISYHLVKLFGRGSY